MALKDDYFGFLAAWRGLPYGHHGSCALCGADREGDEEIITASGKVLIGKPIYLHGHSSELCICLRCFAERGRAPKQPPRTSSGERSPVVEVHVEHSEDHEEIVGKVVELRRQGLGYPKIAEALNEAGVPTFGKPGARWHGPTVRTLLIKVTGSSEAAAALAQEVAA